MAIRNIIAGLRSDKGLQKNLQEIYEDLGNRLEHYVDFTEHQMRVLVAESINETYDNLKGKGHILPPYNPSAERNAVKSEADTCFKQVITYNRLSTIFRKHGFSIVKKFSPQKHASKKVAIIQKLPNGFRVLLPTPKSRMEGSKGRATIGKNLPALYDAGVGPTNDIGRLLVEKTFKKYFKLTTKKLSKNRYSIRGKGGTSIAQSTLKGNIHSKGFTKMHGGDAIHSDQMANPELDPQTRNVEATTAHLVNNIEQLKEGDFSLSGTTQEAIDSGIIKVAQAMDAHFIINGTTVSDIIINKKNVVVGVTLGDKQFNVGGQNLMRHADKEHLMNLYGSIRENIISKLSDPEEKTSKSMKELNTERGAQAIVKEIFGPLTKAGTPDMRFKVNRQLVNKKKTTKKEQAEFKEQFKALTALISQKKGKAKKSVKKTTGKYDPKTTASDVSLGNLMQIVNRSLPRMLKRNMEPPALQYRGIGNPKQGTGPFNTGVRVTSLTQNKQVAGGVNVNYTYEKYPYQTFEPGFKQGSTLRDPRKLIEESIRDIMIERKQSRFLNFRRY